MSIIYRSLFKNERFHIGSFITPVKFLKGSSLNFSQIYMNIQNNQNKPFIVYVFGIINFLYPDGGIWGDIPVYGGKRDKGK